MSSDRPPPTPPEPPASGSSEPDGGARTETGASAAGASDAQDLLSQAFFRDRNVADVDGRESDPPGLMRRALLGRGLAVVGLLVLVDIALRSALPAESLLEWMQSEPATYLVKVQRFTDRPAPDVLILGSSRVRDGLVPEVFAQAVGKRAGWTPQVFNLGLVNAKAEEWRSLVRSHLPDPPPRRVVIAMTGSEVVKVHGFQYASRFLWRAPDFVDYLRRSTWKTFKVAHVEYYLESLLSRAWYLFGSRVSLERKLVESAENMLGLGETDPRRQRMRRLMREGLVASCTAADGFAPPIEGVSGSLAERIRRDEPGVRATIPRRERLGDTEMTKGSRFQLLRDLVTDLASRGCDVVLVEMPSSPYLQALNQVLHGSVFRGRMSELAEDLGVPFVPVPAAENFLSNQLYVDVNHLSPAGARRYSRILARKLVDIGWLKDA